MSAHSAEFNQNKDVLFQKIGHVWYVFTEIGEEVVYCALPSDVDPRDTSLELYEVIEQHLEKVHAIRATDTAA